jgi:hypothetical protein
VLPITAIIVAKDGKPWLAMGTPGMPPQPVTQVLVNILDFGMRPARRPMRRGSGPSAATIGRSTSSRASRRVRDGMAARASSEGTRPVQLAHGIDADHLARRGDRQAARGDRSAAPRPRRRLLTKRVLVLERHYTAGGFTHSFRRPGYEWDVGVHYVGRVGRADADMGLLFREIAGDSLHWASMGDVYDTIVLGDRRFDYVVGRNRWRERLIEYFPAERRAIDEYLAAVESTVRGLRLYFAEKAMPRPVAALTGTFMRSRFPEVGQADDPGRPRVADRQPDADRRAHGTVG